jgi:hypothetical protein
MTTIWYYCGANINIIIKLMEKVMNYLGIFFSVALFMQAGCEASTALRRSMAALSVAAGSKSALQAFTSTTVAQASFADCQRAQPWQTLKSKQPHSKKIVVLPVMSVENKELTSAIASKNWAAVELLLSGGVKAYGVDKNGRTPLVLAIMQEAPLELIKKMLISGAATTIKQQDNLGFNAYSYASIYAPGKHVLASMLYAVETAQWPRAGKITKASDEKTVLQMILDAADLNDE